MTICCIGCKIPLVCRICSISVRCQGEVVSAIEGLTSFHRCLEILSIPVIGSMNTSLTTRVSGTHMAHRRWTHSPRTVCLNAPPSLGQSIQDLMTREHSESRAGWFETYDWSFGRYGALAAEPLAFGDVRNAVAILVYCEIAPVAEDDGVRVLSFRVVTNGARRVFGGHGHVWFRQGLGLEGVRSVVICRTHDSPGRTTLSPACP